MTIVEYALSLMGKKIESAANPRFPKPKYTFAPSGEVAHHRVPSLLSRRRSGKLLYTVKDVPIIRATLIPRGKSYA